ncbi:hypothetical protein [Piscinibacter gummiphilus]|uniref:hypothetical protein n=1 Tax=Piscinibacter gummiphilus TaxID=946333 RepID=UPI0012F48184|nr:hypothetical protein [Piscinibacter gummiphilus]GLS97885.1 hypothetical protein GCM10007918_51770 [Piscinibacter gummiphilus]
MAIQRPPQPDNRYRVHRSVKCYVAELACGTKGCTWYLHDSIQRVVYRFPGGVEKVQFKKNFYALQSSEQMKRLISDQLRIGGAIHLSGKYLAPHEVDQGFEPHPFIDVSSVEEKERYERLLAGDGGEA